MLQTYTGEEKCFEQKSVSTIRRGEFNASKYGNSSVQSCGGRTSNDDRRSANSVKLPSALDTVFSQLMPILGRVAVMLTIRRLNRPTVKNLILVLRESADRLETAYKEDYG